MRADDSAVKLFRECCGFALCLDRFHAGATKQSLSSHKDGDISQFKTKHLLFESHRTAFSTKLKNISTAERNARRFTDVKAKRASLKGKVFKVIMQPHSESLSDHEG